MLSTPPHRLPEFSALEWVFLADNRRPAPRARGERRSSNPAGTLPPPLPTGGSCCLSTGRPGSGGRRWSLRRPRPLAFSFFLSLLWDLAAGEVWSAAKDRSAAFRSGARTGLGRTSVRSFPARGRRAPTPATPPQGVPESAPEAAARGTSGKAPALRGHRLPRARTTPGRLRAAGRLSRSEGRSALGRAPSRLVPAALRDG